VCCIDRLNPQSIADCHRGLTVVPAAILYGIVSRTKEHHIVKPVEPAQLIELLRNVAALTSHV